MSGGWGAHVADEAARLGDQTTRPANMWEQAVKRRQAGHRPLSHVSTTQREAYLQGITDVIALQTQWATHVGDVGAIWELRRGEASIFYPLFKDDPTIWVDCPSGRVHNEGARVLTDRTGMCSMCGYDLVDGPLTHHEQEQRNG